MLFNRQKKAANNSGFLYYSTGASGGVSNSSSI